MCESKRCVTCDAPDVVHNRRCRSCWAEYTRVRYHLRKYGEVRPKGTPKGQGRRAQPKAKLNLICCSCGAAFETSQPKAKFCSRKCKDRNDRELKSTTRPPGRCVVCGLDFAQPRSGELRKCCSPQCTSTLRSIQVLQRPRPEPKPPSSPLRFRQCNQCSCWMVDRNGRKFCSDRCRLNNISGRVMGLYNTAIQNLEIPKAMMWHRKLCAYLADRDGGACGICGLQVDVNIQSGTRGSDDGPSIDHVVPRSLGGSDDLANLRLTHWGCNRKRGNRGEVEQLRLVG